MSRLVVALCVVSLAGCSGAPVQLGANVSQVPSGYGNTTNLDKVDNSFSHASELSFSKIKLCAIENVTNDAVSLKDSSGSFVGAYTGNLYQKNNSQSVGGGNVVKYADDASNTIVLSGNTKANPKSLGLVVDSVKYDLKVSLTPDKVNLIFSNITRAQLNTGAASNDGFRPVGTWAGSRTQNVIDALTAVSSKIETCITNP